MTSLLSNIPPTYTFALISGFAWAITTIVAKQYLLKSFDPMEMYILRMGLGFPLLAILLLFIFNNNPSISQTSTTLPILLKKIKTHITPKLLGIFAISIIAGFLGIYMFWKVLETNNGAYSVAFVWPLVVLFTTLISYFFYNEKISTTQFIGIALVIFGIFLININTSTSTSTQ
jgi:drug/metabolite transporter (DMT)-like permease